MHSQHIAVEPLPSSRGMQANQTNSPIGIVPGYIMNEIEWRQQRSARPPNAPADIAAQRTQQSAPAGAPVAAFWAHPTHTYRFFFYIDGISYNIPHNI